MAGPDSDAPIPVVRRLIHALLLSLVAMMLGSTLVPQLASTAQATTPAPTAEDFIAEVNAHRVAHGLAPLAPSRSLALTADDSLSGLLAFDSPSRTGVDEAFAFGSSPSDAVTTALTIPHRRDVLMSDHSTHIGVETMVSPGKKVHAVIHVAGPEANGTA